MPDTGIDAKKSPAPAAGFEATPDLWQSFRNEIANLFDRFDGGFRLPSMRAILDLGPAGRSDHGLPVPAVDVIEDKTAYTITAELPGLDPGGVELTMSGDSLVMQGEKRQETEEKDKNYYLSERSYGSFRRTFRLPDDVDRDKITATFEKGVLTVKLPKTAAAQKQKTIEVKAA